MPQLIPFYFINQVTFAFILLIIMIYVFSKYILPRFVRLFLSRVFITKLQKSNTYITIIQIITYIFKKKINFFTYNMDRYIFTDNSSPLDQFEIRNLLSIEAPIFANIQISLTNIGLYLTIGAFLVLSLNILATNYNKIVSNR